MITSKLRVTFFMGCVIFAVLTGILLLIFNSSLDNSVKAQKHSAENERSEHGIMAEPNTGFNLESWSNVRRPKNAKPVADFDLQKELSKLESNARCKPEENVLFLKTHKTGSSTVTNILNRFADLRELSVAIPVDGDFRFAWPARFHWTTVDMLRLDGEPANILCNHARYNRPEMDLVMQNNTKYITILRNPVTQFESAFYYFEYDKSLKLEHSKNPLEDFLSDPDEYLYNLTIRNGDLPEAMNLIQSGMFYDLGLDFMDFDDDANVRKTIRRLDREFDLVMIMDYFDESLVLMKRKFCWDFDDVLYIKMNQRLQNKRPNITKSMERKIKEWNRADVLLYEYFNRTFWNEIRKLGQEFWDDLKELRARNRYMANICSPREIVTTGFGIQVEVKQKVMNPTVDRYHRYFCQKMLTSETDYLSYFRKKLGNNYGYQGILIREGIKSLDKPGELRKRLKTLRRKAAFVDLKTMLSFGHKDGNKLKIHRNTRSPINNLTTDRKRKQPLFNHNFTEPYRAMESTIRKDDSNTFSSRGRNDRAKRIKFEIDREVASANPERDSQKNTLISPLRRNNPMQL